MAEKLITIKEFSRQQGVSYEAIRKQIIAHKDALKGHITKKDRTQYLDEEAVKFLTERRREQPATIGRIENIEEIKKLEEEVRARELLIATLTAQLTDANNNVVKLQEESRLRIETEARCAVLEEQVKEKDDRLQDETKKKIEAEMRLELIQETVKAKDAEISRASTQHDDDQRAIEDLRKERDKAQTERDEAREEAQSYKKSIFGLYRKKKQKKDKDSK